MINEDKNIIPKASDGQFEIVSKGTIYLVRVFFNHQAKTTAKSLMEKIIIDRMDFVNSIMNNPILLSQHNK